MYQLFFKQVSIVSSEELGDYCINILYAKWGKALKIEIPAGIKGQDKVLFTRKKQRKGKSY